MRNLKIACFLFWFAWLTGCSDSREPEATIAPDNEAEVQAFFKANPDKFVFATPADLPPNLNWQNGAALPEFADPNAKRGGRLTLRLASMQQTLRMVGPDANGTLRAPLWSANSISYIAAHPSEDGYIPGIAKAWAIDPNDSRRVFLRLDPDARWSDGTPFTMDDVFFSFFMFNSPHIKLPALNRVFEELYGTVTRFDDRVFSITLRKKSPEPLFSITSIPVVQREFYREFGEDYVDRYHWRFPPVTGAYTLDLGKIEKGRHITFDRLPNWWGDSKPFLRHRFNPDHIQYVLIRDDSKAFEAFLQGDFDWQGLNRTDRWYEQSQGPEFTNGYIERAWVYNQLPAASDGVFLNALDPILQNLSVRLGIQHAINYDLVNSALYRGDRRRINSFSDGYGEYSNIDLEPRSFDLDLARQYFEQAGYVNRGPDGVLVNDQGQRLSFQLSISNTGNTSEVATLLKSEALKAGLELNIDALDPTAAFTQIFEKKYQMALHGWNTGYAKLPVYYWELRGVDAGQPNNFNSTNIKDDELDALIDEWDRLDDPERAKAVAHQIQQKVHDYAAWVPGLQVDFTRLGHWRWVKWPDYFQVPRYFVFNESGVFWIDEEVKQKTLAAMKDGHTFLEKTTIYDRWKD